MSNSIEIISWNVNGIRAVGAKEALKWIDEREPDILCLQEIKALKNQVPDDLFNKKYQDILTNSANRKGYSGTMTWSNLQNDYNSTCQNIDTLSEGRIIETHYGDIVLFNVYFPNGQKNDERLAHKMKFYDDFLVHCKKLRNNGKSIIICGDINTAHKEIDLTHPKANSKKSGFLPIERKWIDKLINNDYVDTFRYVHGNKEDCYSWWSYRANARANDVGWRIDYFFISTDLCENLEDAFILTDIKGSDHCPVGIKLSI
ncbi:MAG: exodeoxyribonuclease III [Sulfurimonas sp.]|nr:exodeoxyribonuclease III [Sulfurimonas sp.]